MAWLPIAALLFFLFFFFPDLVPAEFVPQRGDEFRAERLLLAGAEPGEEGLAHRRDRHSLVDGFLDRPAALAGIGHVAPDVPEMRAPAQSGLGQLQEPGADNAPPVPEPGDGRRVETVFGLGLQELEAFGVGLEQAVLDAVVDHLDEVPGSARTEMGIAVRRGQGREDRLEALDIGLVPADHQAIAELEPPDPAARPAIDEPEAVILEGPGA